MKTQAIVLITCALFATFVKAEYKTPGIDSPFNPGHDITVADINEPEVGEGSTPDGVSADQVFQAGAADDSLFAPVKEVSAGVDNEKPVLSVGGIGGRKMLSGRKMLDTLQLSGDGVSAGEGGNGVTTTLAGQGGGNIFEQSYVDGVENGEPLQPRDNHIQPHQDATTVTADGQSVTTGAGVDPDQLGGENNDGVVYTVPGRK